MATLHMSAIGSYHSALYSLETTPDVTRVGAAREFGVSQQYGSGLVLNSSSTLYMLGGITDRKYLGGSYTPALYTVNKTTGVATRVGSATNFGVGEDNPIGMTLHDGVFYMVGHTTNNLYTLNPATGVATRVGSATKFGQAITAWGITSFKGVLYLLGHDSAWTMRLYTLNTTTGVATRLGTLDGLGVSRRNGTIGGAGDVLYFASTEVNNAWTMELYSVNTTTGQATLIGKEKQDRRFYPMGLVSNVAPTESISFSFRAGNINAAAKGHFGTLSETFTLGGRTYTVTHCFTHNNGFQMRFSLTADADAFVKAGFTVDTGISGQPTFLSSVMDYDAARAWAQYRAYAGRYVAETDYTVTITA